MSREQISFPAASTAGGAVIRLAGVNKSYPKISTSGSRLARLFDLLVGRDYGEHFDALTDISFEVLRGQSLALVGENGAGKSTLLKVISGVLKPSTGSVEVNARIAALLELGAGFHPDHSGIENIRLAGALLGVPPKEIERKLPEIVAFADIGEHINDPLKHYSSGMVVRLGFAVATALDPEVLITDEVLAVGDESFQRKCIAWIEAFLARGGTLLLVSHNMYHVQKLCQRALWLEHGRARMFGAAHEVAQAYLAYHEQKSAAAKAQHQSDLRAGAATYTLRKASAGALLEPGRTTLEIGEGLRVEAEAFSPDGRAPLLAVGLVRADGTPVYGTFSDLTGYVPARVGDDSYRFVLRYPSLPLLPGRYFVRVHTMDPEGLRLLDTMESTITIAGETRELGFCRIAHQWGD